jgi:hypothetical protein
MVVVGDKAVNFGRRLAPEYNVWSPQVLEGEKIDKYSETYIAVFGFDIHARFDLALFYLGQNWARLY